MIQIPNTVDEATFVLQQDGTTVTGFPITIQLSSGDFTFSPVYWEADTDLSLGNERRSNIRAFSLSVNFSYNTSLEETELENILDELTNLIDPSYNLYMTVNGTDYIELLPTEELSLSISFSDTIRRPGVQPTLGFVSKKLFKQLGNFFTTI